MRIPAFITLLAAPLALAACDSGEDAAETADTPMAEKMPMEDEMPMMDQSGTGQTANAEGSITAVDDDAGTITIRHGPVPAVNWPAMTMAFEADETLRDKMAVGDAVAFKFRTSDAGNVIVAITQQ